MQVPDLSSPLNFLIAIVAFFIIVMGRYFMIAGIFHAIFYLWFPAKYSQRRLTDKPFRNKQFRKEVGWSLCTSLIFSVAGVATVWLWQEGYTKVYTGLLDYGWWYLPVSLIVSLVVHETYYYWLHRWMHQPKVFRVVHKVHHVSTSTSPWTAFSFHPIEGLLQAIVLPVTLMLLPMHPYVILLQLTIMTFSSVINHLEVEVYPGNFHKHFLGKWLIGATHHSLHHKQFRYNYGLYFTFWDKWKKTESPQYESRFENATRSTQP
jgi:Delta7-sterol 5-desaturase